MRRTKGRKRRDSSGSSRLPSAVCRFRAFRSEEPGILDQVLLYVFMEWHPMTLAFALNRSGVSATHSQWLKLCERVGVLVESGKLVHVQLSNGGVSLPCFQLAGFSLHR